MTGQPYDLLLPLADPVTQPWWDAVKRHELAVQQCGDCETLRHPPTPVCAECGSETIGWRRMSGKGTIYSFVIVHKPTLPQWQPKAPYNILIVSLDDAPQIRLYGNLIGPDGRSPTIGARVQAVFDDVTEDDTLVRWRLDSQAPA